MYSNCKKISGSRFEYLYYLACSVFYRALGIDWIHVPRVLLRPEKFFYQKMNVDAWQDVVGGGMSVGIPRTATMTIPEVFNGKSTCLLYALLVLYPQGGFRYGVISRPSRSICPNF